MTDIDKPKGPLKVYSSPTTMMIPIHVVRPNPWNPNHQDDKTFKALKDSIETTGMISSITVVDMEDGFYRILGGEHRWRAVKALGEDTHIEAKVLPLCDWDDASQKFATVRLNNLSGLMTPESFQPLYEEMEAEFGAEPLQAMFGITRDDEYRRLLKGMIKDLKEGLPKELQSNFTEKAKDAKTAEALTRIVESLMLDFAESGSKSFMTFDYGKGAAQQILVEMDQPMCRAMTRVTDFLTFSGQDINEFMKPVIIACLQAAEESFDSDDPGDANDGNHEDSFPF